MRSPPSVKFKAWPGGRLLDIPQVQALAPDHREAIETVARVLPFRVNRYVVDELIDWSAAPDDPIFRLTFPDRRMLAEQDFEAVRSLVASGDSERLKAAVAGIRARLNPHPAGQTTANVPELDGEPVQGLQHKYRETVLLFPSAGQTCHTYCSYCFRWAQFIGDADLRFATRQMEPVVRYLRAHPEVTDVLITGGDPMVMKTRVLRRYVEPLLDVPSVRTVRIGTKSVAWWPNRFVTDDDADDALRLFEEVVASGRHMALMAHYSHARELQPAIAQQAVRRIHATGAVVRCQAPLIRRVNDDANAWAELWRAQVAVGATPYYMFVERDTGPRGWFEVPLARAVRIYREATAQVGGLARTARGPVMSCKPGKLRVVGVAGAGRDKRFVLQFLQARDPANVGRLLFATWDARAAWVDHLTIEGWDELTSTSTNGGGRRALHLAEGGSHVRLFG